ncbi:hypothetical protein MTO96_030529 [Rhipicephalus appendiculatus]
MAGTDQMSEMFFMGLVLLCAIVVFAVLWTLMRKYCPVQSADGKAASGPCVEAPIGVVPQEASQKPQLKRTLGDATATTQSTAEPKTLDPTAEASAGMPHSGTASVEQSAKGTLSPTRRLTNAARRASVAVSRAVKKETFQHAGGPIVRFRSGSHTGSRGSGNDGDRASCVQQVLRLSNAARKASTAAKAVADQKSTEMEDLPSDKTKSDAAPGDRLSPKDGTLSPGRRFANAARRMSVAASRVVKQHTTNILEALSTNNEVAQSPSTEECPCGAAAVVTEQRGETQPPKSVAPAIDRDVTATDAKAQTNPSIPGEHRPARAASLEATFADKPKDVQKVEAVGTGKGTAQPRPQAPAARPRRKASPVSPPGGDTSSKKRVGSPDHIRVDESTMLTGEHTSKTAHAHRHRRKSKKKSLAGGSATTCDEAIARTDVHSGIGKSSAKVPNAADHKANELESSTQRKL